MRHLVVPLLAGLMIGLMAGPVTGQDVFNDADTIGFGYFFADTLKALPDSNLLVPIFLNTDSTVNAVSVLFTFDHTVISPVISFDRRYQDSLDYLDSLGLGDLMPDSTDWQASMVMDSGLWNVDVELTPAAESTWNMQYGYAQVLYNLRERDSIRFLMTPGTPIEGDPFYEQPYIAGNLNGGLGEPIALMHFKVNSDVVVDTYMHFKIVDENEDFQKTELAEEYFVPEEDTIPLTKAFIPVFDHTWFKADTADTAIIPDDENQLPVLTISGPSSYTVQQGGQVSFTVSATDAEGGELRIYANNGNLPKNATFGSAGSVIGGGGVVSGVFKFKPDISQIGDYFFSFHALDDSGATSSPQVVTVTVEGLEVDILFTSSDSLTPEGGVPGLNEVMVPIDVVTEKVIYGIQFDMDYDPTMFILDSIVNSDRIPDWVTYDNIGVSPGFLRVVSFGLANDPMVPGASSAVMYLAFTVDDYATPDCYPLNIYNGRESIDPDPEVPSLELVTESGMLCVDLWGDVNHDFIIDVADLVSVVAYIIGNYEFSRRSFAAGDIIMNDTVNVVDLVGILNTIFGMPPSPVPSMEIEGEFATLKISHDEIPGAGIESEMAVVADMPVDIAGVEMEILYNPNALRMLRPKITDASNRFTINYNDNGSGRLKVLIHSEHPWNDDELIRTGISDIIKLPFVSKAAISEADRYHVRITKAFMSTAMARNVSVQGLDSGPLPSRFELYQNWPNPFNPFTNIEFYLEGDAAHGTEHVHLGIFNILGQMIRTLADEPLPPGAYQYVWDGTDDSGERAASGVYLYRLLVGEESQAKKMIMIK